VSLGECPPSGRLMDARLICPLFAWAPAVVVRRAGAAASRVAHVTFYFLLAACVARCCNMCTLVAISESLVRRSTSGRRAPPLRTGPRLTNSRAVQVRSVAYGKPRLRQPDPRCYWTSPVSRHPISECPETVGTSPYAYVARKLGIDGHPGGILVLVRG